MSSLRERKLIGDVRKIDRAIYLVQRERGIPIERANQAFVIRSGLCARAPFGVIRAGSVLNPHLLW